LRTSRYATSTWAAGRCHLLNEPTVDSAVLLSVRTLNAGYGRVPILRDFTFSIAAGERVGILGHNGAGKTTLLRTLVGNLAATSGSVEFGETDITGWTTTRRAKAGIGFVPQGRQIFSGLTVRENLRVGCLGMQIDESEAIESILELFPRLKNYLNRPGGALSGGEQQLLALARCLCTNPRLLLLDEPTEGIQPSIREEMIETLARVAAARGLAVLLVEQNVHFLAALTRRILLLERGTIVRESDPQDLLAV